VILHLADRKLMTRDTLSALEAQLGTTQFARINRSTLVHLDQVKELQPAFHGDYVVILRNGARLPLSRAFRGQLGRFITGTL
jgi:two-component system LytT family response regulator